ncbi:hypothetical protein P691DRAFT_770654 [Macrolepiota fuliginosa MF-IS2]|uniref:Uncharacterized protein n=1 Tax=Macrolepiota fuliginosa MF-IS2 TaxID=1400762 RepID=A0A9P5XPC0_9AGAR|nr:hypothetical protein P691DRAFT_770654 [Macrolepiota fuliginosa MF-IS2]
MASFFAPPTSSTSALGPQLEPWHPDSKFETFGSGLDVSDLTPAGEQFDVQKVSIAFLAQHFSINPGSIVYRNGYEDDVTKHAFLGQIYDNIALANADAHVTFNKANKVASVSAAFVTITSTSVHPSSATIPYSAAIKTAEDTLHGTYVPPSTPDTSGAQDDKQFLEYLANQDSSLTLVYGVPVKNDSEGTYFQAYVDAQGGGVVAATNYVAH